ncbi:hypothetical protein B7494_g3335 [Chlorociboria aeruginascens]|nr:hypothetical protein B7494_g3335 [Chlorociboria aeruginascens]
MPPSQNPLTLLSLLFLLLAHTNPVEAGPYPKDNLHDLGFSYLQDRSCYSYCGVDNQFCCSIVGETACSTNAADQASCVADTATAAVGNVFTTTWTETDTTTRTSTGTRYTAVATPTSTYVAVPTVDCVPTGDEIACGIYCCTSSQYCATEGQCADINPLSYSSASSAATSTFSAPVRPTSGGVSTATSTASATTTQPFGTPVAASGTSIPITTTTGSKGLSGGAIAGIVIGVIAAIIILLLICFCCIVKAGFDGLLAIFGLGKGRRRKTERTETVERYSRHGSTTASRRDTHTGWFGGRPTTVSETRKKRSSGFGGLGAIGAGLIGLAVILGLKRRHDRKEKVARTEISSSYYTDSYTGTSASK